MKWTLNYSEKAKKQLRKLDDNPRSIILSWMHKNIDGGDNPRKFGRPLTADLSGQWRYTIGDYRVLCEIQDSRLVVLTLTVGHRKGIYRRK
jgi:mRNA interferase RelE/StbE